MLEFYQQHKIAIENELKDLHSQLIYAGIGSIGEYKNRIIILEKQLEEINEKISKEAKKQIFKEDKSESTTSKPELTAQLNQDVRIIKMFLASSSELKIEREQFEIFINRENKNLIKREIFIELNVWEDFIDAMSSIGLQEEYNKAIRQSDIFVSLFFTKTGKFTFQEFETAFNNFKMTGKPKIYTYFKDAPINTGSITNEIMSLLEFKKKVSDMGHYITTFHDISDLKYQFKMQLEKIIPLL